MSTLTTIASSDLITNSRTVINNNFSALNTDKIETSVLDTDTTLAANSDSKVATQKATKAYADSVAGANASETAKGNVEEATDAEVTAGTATGATGAKLVITPAKLTTRLATVLPVPLTTALGGTGVVTSVRYKAGIATRDLSVASGAVTYAHGLGVTPTRIKLTSFSGTTTGGTIDYPFQSIGTYDGTTNNNISLWSRDDGNGLNADSSTSYSIKLYGSDSAKYQTGVVTVDATNITITWTKTSTPTNTLSFLWEAYAY